MPIDEARLYSHVASQLKEVRGKQKLTQTALADRVGVARTTIANIETGHQRPSLHLLYSLCSVLETEPLRLMPQLIEVSSSEPVSVNYNGQTVAISPKGLKFLSSIDEH